MKTQGNAHAVRWRIDKTSSTGFAVLTHQGEDNAVEVQVEVSRGTSVQFIYGGLTFREIAAGTAVRLPRHSSDPSLPSWNVVTVTWREGNWWQRRRVQRWQGVLAPERVDRPRRRSPVPSGAGIRVPSQRLPL
ncbi:hypothetical protein [Nocardioides sp.]|uniref:hypothetical protein n=1 Tax=Nocardioides sp. TaxID=35761 RepID=UPI003D0AB8A8